MTNTLEKDTSFDTLTAAFVWAHRRPLPHRRGQVRHRRRAPTTRRRQLPNWPQPPGRTPTPSAACCAFSPPTASSRPPTTDSPTPARRGRSALTTPTPGRDFVVAFGTPRAAEQLDNFDYSLQSGLPAAYKLNPRWLLRQPPERPRGGNPRPAPVPVDEPGRVLASIPVDVPPGTSGVALAERLARGRACRKEQIGAVDTSSGVPVDDDRLRFDAGVCVDEHHAALFGGQASIAPRRQHDDHRTQRSTEVGQYILGARRAGLVLAPIEQPGRDEPLEPAGEQLEEMPRFCWNCSNRVKPSKTS